MTFSKNYYKFSQGYSLNITTFSTKRVDIDSHKLHYFVDKTNFYCKRMLQNKNILTLRINFDRFVYNNTSVKIHCLNATNATANTINTNTFLLLF